MFKLLKVIILSLCLASCSEVNYSLNPLAQDAVILAFGDSLTYGTGADIDTESYPAILELRSGRVVVNAGVPGEISQAGLERLPSMLEALEPDLVVLCHGGNDILRRLDKTQLKSNLNEMIQLIKASGAQVVLVAVPMFGFGLTVPDLYPELAQQHQLPIEMTVLTDIVSEPTLKSDQIHPNSKGYDVFGQRVFNLLQQSSAFKHY
jgi:acyl-CoA thioesterase-1